MAKTTKENIKWLARAVMNNGIDCYAVLKDDGECEVGPAPCYSSILQCGHDTARYGIVAMIGCVPEMDLDEAIEYVEEELAMA